MVQYLREECKGFQIPSLGLNSDSFTPSHFLHLLSFSQTGHKVMKFSIEICVGMLLIAVSLLLYPTRKQVQKSRMPLLCLLLQIYSPDQAVQYGGIPLFLEW